MINTWFTSDHHFGHKNILEYEKEARPFASVEEMNEELIVRWNSVVGSTDRVYHLGDFCFGRHNIQIASRLNGKKILIMGNHDVYHGNDYLPYFYNVQGMVFWKRCVLSHMPVHVGALASRASLNLHGHYHSSTVKREIRNFQDDSDWIDDINYFNVSVERHNLTPVHSDLIFERLKEIDR